MDRKEYTPTKYSKLTNITNTNATTSYKITSDIKSSLDYTRQDYTRSTNDYNRTEVGLLKDYQLLKAQVRQLESQNRQLSNDIQNLRYEKNVHETKYHQKVSSEEDTISQFQKEKNYQMGLIKLKNEEEVNRLKRDYEYKIDDLQREIRNQDYRNREDSEKNSYLELKINELIKGLEILDIQQQKLKEANSVVRQQLSREQFTRNKLNSVTEQLESQKAEMEAQIHVLLDIEAEKSKNINAVETQCRNSEATERSLHEKLSLLTQNFASLEEHIAMMKERLISTDTQNEQLEIQLQAAENKLAQIDDSVMIQKEREIQIRADLEVHQQREIRREKQIDQLVMENQRLLSEVNANRQRLNGICERVPI